MLIKTELLPNDLKNKLPISLQITEEFDSELITDNILRYEIENWYERNILGINESIAINSMDYSGNNILNRIIENNDENIETDYSKIIDFIPEYGKNGLSYIIDPVDFLIFNIRNWFRLRRGVYVFDPNFGTKIYDYLKVLDMSQIKEMIYNELSELIDQLTTSFPNIYSGYIVKVKSINIIKNVSKNGIDVSYTLTAALSINDKEEVVLTNEFKL